MTLLLRAGKLNYVLVLRTVGIYIYLLTMKINILCQKNMPPPILKFVTNECLSENVQVCFDFEYPNLFFLKITRFFITLWIRLKA